MVKKYGLFVYAEVDMLGPGGPGKDTEHLDMDHYSNDLEHLIEVAEDIIDELNAFGDGEFNLEIWRRPKERYGMWGATGEPIWSKNIKVHNKIKESKEANMLTEKKKTPIMIQRLIKWKKWKGLKKEDIDKYATDEEKKLLEGFEEEHGIEEADEEPEEIAESPETSDDLIANLIASADDGTLEALLAVIQEELSSRGGDVSVSAEMPDEGGESEEPIEVEGEEDEIE